MRHDCSAQQAAIARLGFEGVRCRTLDEVTQRALDLIQDTLEVDSCGFVERRLDGSCFVLRAGRGWCRTREGASAPEPPESELAAVLATPAPLIVEDWRSERRFPEPKLLQEHGVRSSVWVAVRDAEAPFGVLCAHTRAPRAFEPGDVRFLESVANLVAAACCRYRWDAERAALLERAARARRRAEEALDAGPSLLARAAHELRTPLAAIGGYVELLELGLHGPLTEAQRLDLSRVKFGQKHLLKLLDETLDFSMSRSGRLELHIADFPLDEALADAEGLIWPQMTIKRVRYHRGAGGAGLRVRADRQRLTQIMLNLLSNAAKFTDPGGSVEVECELDAESVRVLVRDSGRGIPEDQIERVFEPFVQVRGDDPAVEGTGLGLAISRDLAAAMGGRIDVKSRPGAGTTFTLILPRGT
jgi:signal transduction histidine kinase